MSKSADNLAVVRTLVGRSMRVSGSLAISTLAMTALLASCTNDAATPIDLSSTSAPPTSGVPLPDDDPNADSRQMAIDFAEQQCVDDPAKDEGIIRIVDPETEEVVGEVIADCAEVRSRPAGG